MRLDKLNRVLRALRLIEEVDRTLITGNQIAATIESAQSRATTYRYLNFAEERGMVMHTETPDGYSWELTGKGLEFLGGYRELGI